MGSIELLDSTPNYWDKIPSIIHAHRLIRPSGVLNVLGLLIHVEPQLKVD